MQHLLSNLKERKSRALPDKLKVTCKPTQVPLTYLLSFMLARELAVRAFFFVITYVKVFHLNLQITRCVDVLMVMS